MTTSRFEITSIPIIKKILASRWLQWSLIAVLLPFFVLAILTGWFGTPSGSRNFGIVFVWIVWWALLMLVLVPLGLAAWAAFSVSFVLMNLSYAWQVLSDPFGWGWNLFGTADWKWTPYLAGWQGLMQVPILLAGLFGAIGVALRTAREQRVAQHAAFPIIAFCVAFTMAMLWLNL